MTPNRRQFVASLAGVPLLLQASTASQVRGNPGAADPVLAQIVNDLRDLSEEARQPGSRKAAILAIETVLGVEAAHLGQHYDPVFQAAVRKRLDRIGRTAFIDESLARARAQNSQFTMSHAEADAALTKFTQYGVAGGLRDVRAALRNARINSPAVALASTAQYDYCYELRWQITMVEIMMTFICGVALIEPTPFGEAGCAALTFTLGYLLLTHAILCSW